MMGLFAEEVSASSKPVQESDHVNLKSRFVALFWYRVFSKDWRVIMGALGKGNCSIANGPPRLIV